MARGERTENHPNRQVSRQSFTEAMNAHSQRWRDAQEKRLQQDNDNAPAGGIKRPEMESCTNCGTETPKGSGSCADCK